MTQYQIAKRLGVSEMAVSKWFTGKSKPRVAHLIALSRLLGKDVNSTLKELEKKSSKNRSALVPNSARGISSSL